MSASTFLDGRVTLHAGDCLDVLRALPDASVDSCVTDPPYALVSIMKRFGKEGAAAAKSDGASGVYGRASSGFMGQRWDTGERAFAVEFWAEVYRVLKPGGHVVAFSATRTVHRLVCAIEDAGFEIRDMIAWLYGTGFPKSHNVGKSIRSIWPQDRTLTREQYYAARRDIRAEARARESWGTALKPALEPICLARKPLLATVAETMLAHGTGALNIDGCRVAAAGRPLIKSLSGPAVNTFGNGLNGSRHSGTTDQGRWPANLVHDGSEEVIAAFPETGPSAQRVGQRGAKSGGVLGDFIGQSSVRMGHDDDGGSAARFFYSAKADADDRLGFKHPTIKPVDLMRWLVRLVTPPGGLVLDPFAGTGTTGEAAFREGMRAVLVEREPTYQGYIAKRMALVQAGPSTRRLAAAEEKARRAKPAPFFGLDATPLPGAEAAE